MNLYESITKAAKLNEYDNNIEYVCHSDTDANNENEYFDNEEDAIKYAEEHKDTIDVVIKVDHLNNEEDQIWINK